MAARETAGGAGATLFDVNAERFNNEIIGLSDIVKRSLAAAASQGVDSSEAVAQLLMKALGQVFQEALPVDLAMVASLLIKDKLTPKLVLKCFRMISPPSISASFLTKHHFRQQSDERPVKTVPWLIDGYSFDLDAWPAFRDAQGPAIEAKLQAANERKPVSPELLPGLYYGTHRPWLVASDELVASALFSELFSRLMLNYSAFAGSTLQQRVNEADEIFTVHYRDQAVTRLDHLLQLLYDDAGATIEAGILKSCALFGFLMCYQDPTVPAAPFQDVPFTLFVQTGVVCRHTGKQAYVPMSHSAFFFSYKGPNFTFSTEFYLGSGGNARFRSGARQDLPWARPHLTSRFTREEALEAVRGASLIGNLMNALAVKCRLLNGGYGTNGVCADSVAPVEHLITGSVSVYPLLGLTSNRNQTIRLLQELMQAIRHILAEQPRHPFLRPIDLDAGSKLIQSILALPTDSSLGLQSYPSTLPRILQSLPWPEGSEPFLQIEKARNVIRAEIEAHTRLLRQ